MDCFVRGLPICRPPAKDQREYGMSSSVVTNLISAGFPLLLLWIKLGSVFGRMAERKGTSKRLAFIGAFPVWALVFAIWLMTRSDRQTVSSEDALSDEAHADRPE